MKTRRTAALLLFFMLVLAPAMARAHALGISAGAYGARGSSVVGTLTFARAELASLLPALDANGDGHLSALEVSAARELLRERILARVIVTSGPSAEACAPVLLDAGLTEQDGLVVQGRWDCTDGQRTGDPPFVIDLALLDDLPAGHRHIVGSTVLAGDDRRLTLARELPPASSPVVATPATPATPAVWSLFTMGIEHILSGYDHLVFLLGLVVVLPRTQQTTVRSMRSILAIVTAFTAGHSISLAAAVLGSWTPSPRIVEPAIALSIVYVGVENFFVTTLRARWRITFPFGLVHGFGLAGALQAIALPRPAIPLALVSFNVGVEAGQLAVLALLLPVLVALRSRRWFSERGVPIVSGAIAIAGGVWLVVRLFG